MERQIDKDGWHEKEYENNPFVAGGFRGKLTGKNIFESDVEQYRINDNTNAAEREQYWQLSRSRDENQNECEKNKIAY